METHETIPLPLGLSDRISPELSDRIIDHLHSFIPSLSACSIVCHSWFPSSRYHIFFDVNLSPNLVNFLYSSHHAMETIAPYIQEVGIGGAWISKRQIEFDPVVSLLLKLESCRTLYLEAWSWDFLSSASSDLLLRSEGTFCRNITDINLKYIRFPSFSLLTEFVGRFPMLEALSIDNVTWDFDGDCVPLQTSCVTLRPLRLTKLYVRSCLVEVILSWIFGEKMDDFDGQELTCSPVRVLSLPEILRGDLNITGRVLRALGSCLQHVELGLLPPTPGASANHGPPGLVDLSYNTKLRRIRVHQLILYHLAPDTPPSFSPKPHSPYYWLIPMLSGVLSPFLEELVFTVWLSAESQLELIDWAAMRWLLFSYPFSGLHKIKFEVMGMGRGREHVRTWLTTRLGLWTATPVALEVKFIDGYL